MSPTKNADPPPGGACAQRETRVLEKPRVGILFPITCGKEVLEPYVDTQ